ncbi:Ubiquinone biosynthesis monooxygenase COQ6, mitochondrial [Abortiporus biennis]
MLTTTSSHVLNNARRCCSSSRLVRLISTSTEQKDVVIVGGGPAGLAFAAALGSSKVVSENLRITLIEAGDLSKTKAWTQPEGTFSNRVSSITNSSRGFLEDIGAWSLVDQGRTCSIEEMQIWDGVSDARITFSASDSMFPGGRPRELSRLTENLNLQRALLHQLASNPSVELADKVKVESITREENSEDSIGGGWPLVHLSDGRTIRARLLVGADGFNSPVRKYAGIQSYGWAYDTHGVVGTLFHEPRGPYMPPNTIAYQRFLPTGPIAFLPLSETASSMVWSTKPYLASALKSLDPAVLACMINAAFRLPEVSVRYLHTRILEAAKAGTPLSLKQVREEIEFRERSHDISTRSAYSSLSLTNSSGIPPEDADSLPPLVTGIQPGSVASFPLRFSHAESYIGEGAGSRTVLLGDAAHTTHPLAGQGLNMGLGDAESLSKCIHNAVLRGGDIGSYSSLAPYPLERYFENHKLLAAVDKLHKLYSFTAEPVVWARSVGVEVLNELDTVKTAMMMQAGSHRNMPRPGRVGIDVATNGLEMFASGLNTARSIGEGAVGILGAVVKQLVNPTVRRK